MTDLEKRKEIVAQLKPIDDAFATKLLEDPLVCQEVLATILNEQNLTVEEVTAQNTIKNLQGRSVQLDALCKRTDGTFFNVEIQKRMMTTTLSVPVIMPHVLQPTLPTRVQGMRMFPRYT